MEFVRIEFTEEQAKWDATFERFVLEEPRIVGCWQTTGDDYLLCVLTKGREAYNNVMEALARKVPCKRYSTFVTKDIKPITALPLDHLGFQEPEDQP